MLIVEWIREVGSPLRFEFDQVVHIVNSDGANVIAKRLDDDDAPAACCARHAGRDLVPIHERGDS